MSARTKPICLVIFVETRIAQDPAIPASNPCGPAERWRWHGVRVTAEGVENGDRHAVEEVLQTLQARWPPVIVEDTVEVI